MNNYISMFNFMLVIAVVPNSYIRIPSEHPQGNANFSIP